MVDDRSLTMDGDIKRLMTVILNKFNYKECQCGLSPMISSLKLKRLADEKENRESFRSKQHRIL